MGNWGHIFYRYPRLNDLKSLPDEINRILFLPPGGILEEVYFLGPVYTANAMIWEKAKITMFILTLFKKSITCAWKTHLLPSITDSRAYLMLQLWQEVQTRGKGLGVADPQVGSHTPHMLSGF